MTSLFDQYEQASQRVRGTTAPIIRPEMSTTGFIHMKLEEETPIFSKHKVNFSPAESITHLAVSNDHVVVAMANYVLLRISVQPPEKKEEIDLGKYANQFKLGGLFLDPTGNHVLLSMISRHTDHGSELFYLSKKSVKPSKVSRNKNHEVTAVGWNHANESESVTGPILLGTSKGLILEAEMSFEGDKIFQTGQQYWKQLPSYLPLYGTREVDGLVFDIGKGENVPITGLEFHRIPSTDTYFILVTTPCRLYQFIGSVTNAEEKLFFTQIFSSYISNPERFQEIPSNLKYSRLEFHYQTSKGLPKIIAWLTEPGIFYGQLDTSNSDSVLSNSQLLHYPAPSEGAPLAFVITEFHTLLLFADHVKGVSLLNHELIFEDYFSETVGKLVSITKDPIRGTIWVYTEKAVFRYKVTQEERNVWQIFAKKGEFELAKQYCRDNPAHLDQVLVKEAEMYFNKKEYEKSAIRYAETHSSFEEIALKFLQAWQIEALNTFLKKKLEGLRPQDKTQVTMIVMWVLELFLNQLGCLRDEGKERTQQYSSLQKELDSFLNQQQVQECVRNNRGTVYDLMASHGDKHNLIRLTIMNKDFERVIRHHINENSYLAALDVLKTQNRKELFYQFTPVLIQAIPRETVQVLIEKGRSLSPTKLLPALVSCDREQANEAIRYLEFCVNTLHCQQQAIHNYLLSLYARMKPDKLMHYLASQGQEPSMVCYDIHYALRLCRELHLTEACVQLSALLGLWEAAVDLALTVDVGLAKQTANLPQADSELRKKLWLKIAQHVVSEKNDIQQAMQFLQECDLIKIEDILPFFSDFVTIDHFKDAICTSLQEYNQHIQDLKEEMEEATKSAEVIREEIQAFRNRYARVQVQDVCCECELQLLMRPFYLFPCGHRFHGDCLLAEVTPVLPAGKRNKLHELQRQLQSMSGRDDAVSLGSATMSARDQLKADIDSIIASECLYCGEYMIRSIDRPFIDDEDYERVMKEWE
ncbi:vacuolar protein sorting-associated protein 18 homolog isoform X1 [Schistocerca nitens]|uniref:vacuolar protein sorting-associated protein 18 homolog isoform X1 n=1 Tax=Schistocerca nitens TaxID=7011 RepID=UPI00211732C5|nr:vacuolar protein sorting-associated protein 18 homolog isoform X1 [Schistocerca nitens]